MTSNPKEHIWDYYTFTYKDGIMRPLTICGANFIADNPEVCGPSYWIEDPNEMMVATWVEFTICIPQGEYLGRLLDRVPFGTIDKTVPGIGATTLELVAPRNSIIVVPTKALAISKHLKPQHETTTLYVGSPVEGLREDGSRVRKPRPTNTQIREYVNNPNIKHKKMLVVADSLPRVINAIGESVYSDYFLMVDEVDVLQTDSTFRDALPVVIDYYKEFPVRNRSLVSATVREFSDPDLTVEKKVVFKYPKGQARNIETVHTNNVNVTTRNEILRHIERDDKVVIAYNSLDDIRTIIKLLEEHNIADIGILCSERSQEKAGSYYAELEGSKLKHKFTFMTCAYFVGIDINEPYHLISVSSINTAYSILSLETLTQLAGRCRMPNRLITDTIIYDTGLQADGAPMVNNGKRYINETRDKAQLILNLFNASDELAIGNTSLQGLSDEIKEVLCAHTGKGIPGLAGSGVLNLVRKNIKGKYEIHYLNLDALTNIFYCLEMLYTTPSQLPNELQSRYNHNVTQRTPVIIPDADIDAEEAAKEEIIDSNKKRREATIKVLAQKLLDPNTTEQEINHIVRNSNRDTQEFLERFVSLSPYVPKANLVPELIRFDTQNDDRGYNNYQNKAIFWALADNHPFKSLVKGTFPLGQTFASAQIGTEINKIMRAIHASEVSQVRAVQIFNYFIDSKRKRGAYQVNGYGANPFNNLTPTQTITEEKIPFGQIIRFFKF